MRTTTALLVALVILAAVFAVLRLGFERGGREEPLFPGFKPELASRITIKGKKTETVIEKQNNVWIVTSEDSFPSETEPLETIFEGIMGFSRKDIISSNPEKQALYQVDSTGVFVAIENSEGDTMASFVVGKVGPDYQSTYVRDARTSDVILAPGYLGPKFDRGNRTWQDKRVYALEPSEIVEIGISRPGETIELRRDEAAEWFISQPESAACDPNKVRRLVRTIAYLRCDDFAGRAPVPESGLDEPDSLVWFRLRVGGEERLFFGDQAEAKRIYAKRENSDIVYLLASYKVKSMLPRMAELRKKEEEPEKEL